jgi:hypothetical protein
VVTNRMLNRRCEKGGVGRLRSGVRSICFRY